MSARTNRRTTAQTLPLFPDHRTAVIEVEVGAADAGDAHLSGIPVEQRRQAGQVYTPGHLVEFILTQAGYEPSKPLTGTLLDPACGPGIFLLRAIIRLARSLADAPETPAGRTRLLEAVSANIHGFDIDATACALARTNVRQLVAKLCKKEPPRGFFGHNIANLNYLLDPLPRDRFDFVVGNPPYVSATRIPNEQKARLRLAFKTAQGRLDLYTLFMERAVSTLAPGGVLAFITPNKFLGSVTSRSLRALLVQEGAVRTIVNFRSHKVFEDAATVPCVTVFERGGKPAPVELLECDEHGGARGATREVRIERRAHIEPSRLAGGAAWTVVHPDLLKLADKIRREHPQLAQYVSRVSAGFATGLDPVFVVAKTQDIDVEPELKRPAIRGRDLLAYRADDPGLEIIVPYRYDASGKPALIDIKAFPKAKSYLGRFKAELENRHCFRVWSKAWFDIHDPVPFDLAAQPKILVPDLASSNRFVFDAGRFCPLHSAYYLLPSNIEPLYLTAVLNSKPIEFLMRLFAPVAKDGFSRYRKQFMMPLPIPALAKAEQEQVSALVQAGHVEEAEARVADAFTLRPTDLKAIDEFLGRVDFTATGRSRTTLAR